LALDTGDSSELGTGEKDDLRTEESFELFYILTGE
jgi:hypothetical protein